KYYGATKGIEDVSIQVKRGEVYGFLGLNGAGKTTTIRILLDLIRPTSGRARVFGLDCQRDSFKVRRRVGYLPEDASLYRNMSGRGLLNFLGDIDKNVDKDFLRELVERFDIDLEKRVKDYSKGMRQKLALIQAFMSRPDLIILDEPTGGLDPLMQQEFYKLVEEERLSGRTIFMSSHNLAEVQRVCDRVGIIREGSMMVVEEVEALRREAGKIVRVSFAEDVDGAHLETEGVVSISRSDGYFTIAVGEDIDSVVKKISKFKINDMTIQEATLEDIFFTYYQGEKET
ncbi:MAG: ATP-binding cassette domain-containing protein, partial [Nitrososphaerales archaeon]